jgi:hypothetical protein
MTNQELQINSLMRTIGTLQTSVGLKTIMKAASEFETNKITGLNILSSLKKLGINSSNVSQLDALYYTTSWDNWKKILETVWGIVKNFNWVEDKFDCDNRAAFVTVLCGLLFGVNTCSSVYCQRDNQNGGWSGRHWTNIAIDKDGNTYLFDVDNNGLMQKIDNNDCLMGNEKYHFISARVY